MARSDRANRFSWAWRRHCLLVLALSGTAVELRASAHEVAGAARPDACLARLNRDDRQFEKSLKGGLRLISRGETTEDRFYLASNKALRDSCGRRGVLTVYDVVRIPKSPGTWAAVSFDCTSSSDAAVRRGIAVVGAFEIAGERGDTRAKRAWVSDSKSRRLKIASDVTCHSFDR